MAVIIVKNEVANENVSWVQGEAGIDSGLTLTISTISATIAIVVAPIPAITTIASIPTVAVVIPTCGDSDKAGLDLAARTANNRLSNAPDMTTKHLSKL